MGTLSIHYTAECVCVCGGEERIFTPSHNSNCFFGGFMFGRRFHLTEFVTTFYNLNELESIFELFYVTNIIRKVCWKQCAWE